VRRAGVREFSEQILAPSHVISRQLPIARDGNKAVHNIVGAIPPIVRCDAARVGS
jgi:hypothetical protein